MIAVMGVFMGIALLSLDFSYHVDGRHETQVLQAQMKGLEQENQQLKHEITRPVVVADVIIENLGKP